MFWILIACNSSTPQTHEEVFYPDREGGFAVSTVEEVVVHSEGFDMPIQIWYPVTEPDEDLYVYDELISGTAGERGTPLCDEKRDVILFSHGNQGLRYQSYFLTEYLASHGYIVVAPRHVDNSFFDYDSSAMSEMVFRRPIDIANSYDWLLDYEPLVDCIDETKGYAIVGHSFGGYTTVALSGASIDTEQAIEYCSSNGGWLCDEVQQYQAENGAGIYDLSDPRVWAGIPLAPAGFETLLGGLDQVNIPMLVIGGELDTSTTMDEQVLPIYSGLTSSDAAMVEMLGVDHYAFSNACEILPTSDYCQEGGLETSQAHSLLQTMIVAFLAQKRGMAGMEEYLPPESEHIIWTD
jgi:predicted dienelactone hydrolase